MQIQLPIQERVLGLFSERSMRQGRGTPIVVALIWKKQRLCSVWVKDIVSHACSVDVVMHNMDKTLPLHQNVASTATPGLLPWISS